MTSRRARMTSGIAPYALVLLAVAIFLVPVLVNPGFFSHDEWQKADDVALHGLADYLSRYGSFYPGAAFGVPVRPLAFAIQGVLAPWMRDAPWVVHLADVAMHLAACWLLLAAVRRFTGDARLALASALLFAISPLALPSVVWPSALMDRLYVTFGLAALLATHRFLVERRSIFWLAASTFACALAIASKETALVLPGVLGIWAWLRPALLRDRRFWMAVAAWSLPPALYVGARLPGLLAPHAATTGAYAVSLGNLRDGLLLYFTFPFLTDVDEAVNWVFAQRTVLWSACAAHAALVAAIAWTRGWRIALAYVGAYFLFLAPVLMIATRGGHYLYGSGTVMAVALAMLLLDGRRVWTAAFALGAIVAATSHAWTIESSALDLGRCMGRAAVSVESAFAAVGRPPALHIASEPGAHGFILQRLFTGRDQVGTQHPVRFFLDTPPDVPAAELVFDASCEIRPAPGAK
jgi:hypothetical protein